MNRHTLAQLMNPGRNGKLHQGCFYISARSTDWGNGEKTM